MNQLLENYPFVFKIITSTLLIYAMYIYYSSDKRNVKIQEKIFWYAITIYLAIMSF